MATSLDTVRYIIDQAGLGRWPSFRKMFSEYLGIVVEAEAQTTLQRSLLRYTSLSRSARLIAPYLGLKGLSAPSSTCGFPPLPRSAGVTAARSKLYGTNTR